MVLLNGIASFPNGGLTFQVGRKEKDDSGTIPIIDPEYFNNLNEYIFDSTTETTRCPEIELMSAENFSWKKISPKDSSVIISDFTSRHSLSIILGQCAKFPLWLEDLQCSGNLHIYIYLKCKTKIDEILAKFDAERYSCIQTLSLTEKVYMGQQGTIKHFLYKHYYNLTEYSVFLKDNNKRYPGISILQRLASALLNLEKSERSVRFMTLSDVPPAFQSRIKTHSPKTRSVQISFQTPRDIKRHTMRIDPNSEVSKYCKIFEKFTCKRCRVVWVPVRSQFLLSREAINAIDREEFDIVTSVHDEYTWPILFNCFVEKLQTRKKAKVYPFISCLGQGQRG